MITPNALKYLLQIGLSSKRGCGGGAVMATSMKRPLMTSKVMAVVLCLVAATASAQGDLKTAPACLSLQIVSDKPGERCGRSDASDSAPLVVVSLHRTFHDDFDEHPLLNGRWVSHYAGAGSLLEWFYAGREGSVLRRKTKYNGEQQIYVDPGYEGRGLVPLGLDHSRFEMACCRLSHADTCLLS